MSEPTHDLPGGNIRITCAGCGTEATVETVGKESEWVRLPDGWLAALLDDEHRCVCSAACAKKYDTGIRPIFRAAYQALDEGRLTVAREHLATLTGFYGADDCGVSRVRMTLEIEDVFQRRRTSRRTKALPKPKD